MPIIAIDANDVAKPLLVDVNGYLYVNISNSTIAVTQSGTWNVGLNTGTNLIGKVKLVDTAGTNELAVDSSGYITVNRNWSLASGTDSVDAAQSGTWNVGLSTGSNLVGKIKIVDTAGTNELAIDASGYITVNKNWNLSSASDSISAVQSGTWNVGTLTSITNAVTVTATDLDIRNLAHTQDTIAIYGTSDAGSTWYPIRVNTSGEVVVNTS